MIVPGCDQQISYRTATYIPSILYPDKPGIRSVTGIVLTD